MPSWPGRAPACPDHPSCLFAPTTLIRSSRSSPPGLTRWPMPNSPPIRGAAWIAGSSPAMTTKRAVVARIERSEIRERSASLNANPRFRGARHRASRFRVGPVGSVRATALRRRSSVCTLPGPTERSARLARGRLINVLLLILERRSRIPERSQRSARRGRAKSRSRQRIVNEPRTEHLMFRPSIQRKIVGIAIGTHHPHGGHIRSIDSDVRHRPPSAR